MKKLPIFYSALLLTCVNLLLRLVGTSFQIYLSGLIGAEGIGLLQLILSISMMANVAAIAGIRTSAMYLTAEELGKNRGSFIRWILSACLRYSMVTSLLVVGVLYMLAPTISVKWIGRPDTLWLIRSICIFLPINCFNCVMVGYFTGASKIGWLAAVEVAEQALCMLITVVLLKYWAKNDTIKCCQAVILGNGLGGILTLVSLVFLRLRENAPKTDKISLKKRLFSLALPLAAADDLKVGINTLENMMVPRRLALFSGIASPLAAFGMVTGMVFPILMFPACVLYGLNELLIPELARCNASESNQRVMYLVKRGLKVAFLYGLTFGGLEFLLAEALCLRFYNSTEAGSYLRMYAILIPMLYCDAIVDAMTKGLGQQKKCVFYNILTSTLDVVFLYYLLPKYGMNGYFASFLVTHLINFILSIYRLFKITKLQFPLRTPLLAAISAGLAIMAAGSFTYPWSQMIAYLSVMMSLFYLTKVISMDDIRWIAGLVKRK